jgi:hypothetical protein
MRTFGNVVRVLAVIAFGFSICVLALLFGDNHAIKRWAKARGAAATAIENSASEGPYKRVGVLNRIYRVETEDKSVYWIKFAPGQRPRATLQPGQCRCPTPHWIAVDPPEER